MKRRGNPAPPKLRESTFRLPLNRGMAAEVHLMWSEPSDDPGTSHAWEFGWTPMRHSAVFEPQIIIRRQDGTCDVRLAPGHQEIEFPWSPGNAPKIDDRSLRVIGMKNYFVLIEMAKRFSERWPDRASALRYAQQK